MLAASNTNVINQGCVPNQAFNMWIAQHDRLPTRERICSWGISSDRSCPVCLFGFESRDHILLHCGFSSQVWRFVLAKLDPRRTSFTCWSELLSWLRDQPSHCPSILRKIVTQTTIFQLWKQRNNLLHNRIFIPASTVFRIIDREVRYIILGRRHKRLFKNLLSFWLV